MLGLGEGVSLFLNHPPTQLPTSLNPFFTPSQPRPKFLKPDLRLLDTHSAFSLSSKKFLIDSISPPPPQSLHQGSDVSVLASPLGSIYFKGLLRT